MFGLKSDEVDELKAKGYDPYEYYAGNSELKEAIDSLAAGHFSNGDRELFKPLVDNLLHKDPFLLLADYQSYIECQERVSQAYQDRDNWTRMSILKANRSDRHQIWITLTTSQIILLKLIETTWQNQG